MKSPAMQGVLSDGGSTRHLPPLHSHVLTHPCTTASEMKEAEEDAGSDVPDGFCERSPQGRYLRVSGFPAEKCAVFEEN